MRHDGLVNTEEARRVEFVRGSVGWSERLPSRGLCSILCCLNQSLYYYDFYVTVSIFYQTSCVITPVNISFYIFIYVTVSSHDLIIFIRQDRDLHTTPEVYVPWISDRQTSNFRCCVNGSWLRFSVQVQNFVKVRGMRNSVNLMPGG
jgi:hypothetical protein